MIYIVGTQITVGQAAKVANKTQSVKEMLNQRSYTPPTSSPFKPGNTYHLIYIRRVPNSNMIDYMFENASSGEQIVQSFSNTNEADMFIAQLKNSVVELMQLREEMQKSVDGGI